MTEIKWVDGVLHCRSLVPTWQASGAWGELSHWTNWKPVPVENSDGFSMERANWGNGPKQDAGGSTSNKSNEAKE